MKRQWTTEEDEILRKLFPDCFRVEYIADEIFIATGIVRGIGSIYWRARVLDIKRKDEDGYIPDENPKLAVSEALRDCRSYFTNGVGWWRLEDGIPEQAYRPFGPFVRGLPLTNT